ncbi:MAG: hypothetical protein JXR91_12475 [Deltaproteobacteria bacterium]|nr:hypothetical protein [Deltaproteobacteria bacterium]
MEEKNQSKLATCGMHNLKFDPTKHQGCVLCQKEQAKSDNRFFSKKSLWGGLSVMIFFVSYWIFGHIHFGPPYFDENLHAASQELNKKCPMIIDSMTVLKSTLDGPGNQLTLIYSVNGLDFSELNKEELFATIKPTLIENYKTNKDLRLFKNNGTILTVVYFLENGKELTRIKIDPKKDF